MNLTNGSHFFRSFSPMCAFMATVFWLWLCLGNLRTLFSNNSSGDQLIARVNSRQIISDGARISRKTRGKRESLGLERALGWRISHCHRAEAKVNTHSSTLGRFPLFQSNPPNLLHADYATVNLSVRRTHATFWRTRVLKHFVTWFSCYCEFGSRK